MARVYLVAASPRSAVDLGRGAHECTAGSSLVELLVALLVVAGLMAVAIPVLGMRPLLAYEAAVASDLRNAAIQVESHRHEHADVDVRLVTTGTASEGEVRVPRSDGVTVTGPIPLPGGGYCLVGAHEAVAPPGGAPGDPIRWWDSDARQVVDEAPSGC